MRRILHALIAGSAALFGLAGTAHAGNVHWSVGINLPPVGTVISNGPVYPAYAPAYPVYAPAPVYAPPPVVYRPAPVYYPPAVVYGPPRYYGPPRAYGPPRYYGPPPGWRHHHGGEWRR